MPIPMYTKFLHSPSLSHTPLSMIYIRIIHEIETQEVWPLPILLADNRTCMYCVRVRIHFHTRDCIELRSL